MWLWRIPTAQALGFESNKHEDFIGFTHQNKRIEPGKWWLNQAKLVLMGFQRTKMKSNANHFLNMGYSFWYSIGHLTIQMTFGFVKKGLSYTSTGHMMSTCCIGPLDVQCSTLYCWFVVDFSLIVFTLVVSMFHHQQTELRINQPASKTNAQQLLCRFQKLFTIAILPLVFSQDFRAYIPYTLWRVVTCWPRKIKGVCQEFVKSIYTRSNPKVGSTIGVEESIVICKIQDIQRDSTWIIQYHSMIQIKTISVCTT